MPKREGVVYEIDGVDYAVGETYELRGEELVFRGMLEDHPVPSRGLYWDQGSWEFVAVTAGAVDAGLMASASEDPPSRGAGAGVELSSGGDEESEGRQSGEDLLRFKVSDEDDEIVRKLKSIINGRRLTLRGVMEAGLDYNLVYGLRMRHSIKLGSLEKWARLLRLRVSFDLVPEDAT
jgi:hypothetical protein